jgi:iron complex transport system ATP-binding protein
MLAVREVSAGYGGNDVIHKVTLESAPGELFCVAGPNGCGKSTLLKAIAGVLPCRGSVTVNGRELSECTRRARAQKVALLAQESPAYFPYTVHDTVAMGRYAYGRGFLKDLSPQDQEAVEGALRTLALGDLRNRRIDELSGGQLQRVFLARALAQAPEVILLDEPTNHLDITYQLEFIRYLGDWVRQTGKTAVMALHDLNLVRHFADRIALMREGVVVKIGLPREVLTDETLRPVYGADIGGFMRESLAKWEA